MGAAQDKLTPAEVFLESMADEKKAELAAKLNDWARRPNPLLLLIAENKITFQRVVISSTWPIDKVFSD